MAIYAIGDVQGCVQSLHRLLEKISFDPANDRLWFVGDLVNRGPHSLEVLRFVKQLGSSAMTVLGNHDVHLLAVWANVAALNRKDTFQPVLSSPDAEELLTWLRFRPLVHVEGGYCVVHAGLLPSWSIAHAVELAHEVEEALQHDHFHQFLPSLYFRKDILPAPGQNLNTRLSLTTNVLTRLRICTDEGVPDFSFKGHPDNAPPGYKPWFRIPNRAARHHTILFGHWSALGAMKAEGVFALDGGCVWGRDLVSLRLDDYQWFRVACPKM